MHLRKTLMAIGLVASTSFVAQGASAQAASVDPALPSYAAATGVAGNLTSVGSDTLNNVMTLWAETFKRFYPNVNIQIQGAGSGTAPPALTAGAANFGPMSRLMSRLAHTLSSTGYALERKPNSPLTIPWQTHPNWSFRARGHLLAQGGGRL